MENEYNSEYSNEYKDYQLEEEPKKFQIKRWMIIAGALLLLVIVIIVIVIIVNNKNKEPQITESACRNLETRMAEEAEVYIENNMEELTEEKRRIDFTELLDTNGGNIDSSKIPQLDTISGYVEAYIEDDSRIYDAYIMCSDVYKTAGYQDEEEITDSKPTIKLKGKKSITIYVGDTYVDQGATATDKEDGDLTDKIVTEGSVDSKKKGKYTIKYSVEDSYGNKSTKKRTVTVKEKTTTSSSTTTKETTTTTKTTTTKRNVTTKRKTTTARRVTTTRKVIATTRRITTPPTISLVGSSTVTMYVGQSYKEPGYSAKDALNVNITSRVKVTNNIVSNVAGRYSVNYSVTDSYGNRASARRTVNVIATGSIKGVTLTPTRLDLKVGRSGKLTASISSTGTVDKTLTWKTSNSSVATVSSDGTVRANAAGTAYITVTTKNGKTAKSSVVVTR